MLGRSLCVLKVVVCSEIQPGRLLVCVGSVWVFGGLCGICGCLVVCVGSVGVWWSVWDQCGCMGSVWCLRVSVGVWD